MKRICVAALLFLAGSAASGVGAEPTLKVGDPAPKLEQGKYVQGEPVKEFARGKAYIVEFWATWCGPCRVSIPHLNDTWTKYKDKGLIVIGQDCWEHNESLVEPFVKKMGDKMTYRVALDDKTTEERGAMAKTWMQAAGQSGIPTAFLVDTQGRVAWIGHPITLQGKIIEDVLAGKFDAEQYAKTQVRVKQAFAAVGQAMRKKDWDEAASKLAEAEKLVPDDERDQLDRVRLAIFISKQDYAAAYKLVAKISDANKDDAELQNGFAWQIAMSPDIKERDLALAETLATRGNEAAKGKDPSILNTLARIKFMRGSKEEAIVLQEKAVQQAEESQKLAYQRTLDEYTQGKSPLTRPFPQAPPSPRNPRLAGIVSVWGRQQALLAFTASPPYPAPRMMLSEGQREDNIQVDQIEPDKGSVKLTLDGSGAVTVRLRNTTNAPVPGIVLEDVDLNVVLELFANCTNRSLLRWPSLPELSFNVSAAVKDKYDAARVLAQSLTAKGLSIIPDGEKFLMIVPESKAASVKPHAPSTGTATASGAESHAGPILAAGPPQELLPAGTVDWHGIELSRVAEVCSTFMGRKFDQNERVPVYGLIYFRTVTPLTKVEVTYALETLLLWNGVKLVPVGRDAMKAVAANKD